MTCTYSDSSEQTFGHIGDDDTNQEDDSLQPAVTQREREDEETDTKEHGHGGDDVDEMLNLQGDGRVTDGETGRQVGDTSHDGSVPGADDDTVCGTYGIK